MWSCFIIYMIFCTYAACFFYYLFMLIYKIIHFLLLYCVLPHESTILMYPFHLVIDLFIIFLHYNHSEDLPLYMSNDVMFSLRFISRSESDAHFHSTRICQNALQSGCTKFAFPYSTSCQHLLLHFLNCCQSNGYNGILF